MTRYLRQLLYRLLDRFDERHCQWANDTHQEES